MANIFELNAQMAEFQRLIAESDDLPEEVIRDTLEGLEGEIDEKIRGYAAVIKNIEGEIAAMKAAEKDIADRRKVLENKISRMKDVVDETMRAQGIDQINDPRFQIGYRRCPASVGVLNEEEIPDYLWVPQDPRLDKKAALELLKEGQELPGLQLIEDKRNFFIK